MVYIRPIMLPINFHPKPGHVLICDFNTVVSGYKSNSDNWLQQEVSGFGTKEVESA